MSVASGSPWASPTSMRRRCPLRMFLLTRGHTVTPRQTLHLWYTCPLTNHKEPLFAQLMFYFEPRAHFCLPLCISLLINLAEDEEAELKLAPAIVSFAHAKNTIRKELEVVQRQDWWRSCVLTHMTPSPFLSVQTWLTAGTLAPKRHRHQWSE